MGPRDTAGKKVNEPIMAIVIINKTQKVIPEAGKVPDPGGIVFFLAMFPARANTGIIIKNLPISMAIPMATLYPGLLVLRPANALPLLPVAEE